MIVAPFINSWQFVFPSNERIKEDLVENGINNNLRYLEKKLNENPK